MRMFLMLFAMLLTFQAHAEVFKCKDAKNKITYQNSPCLITTVGKIRKDAAIPEEDRMRAQDRLDKDIETERQKRAEQQARRLQNEENAKKYELEQEAKANEKRKIELLERQAIAAEQGAIAANQARIAAERAEQAAERASQPIQNQRLHCRPDYAGGLICD